MSNLDVATLKGSVFDKSKARLRSIADRIAFPLTFATLHASVSGYKDLRRTYNGQTLCREHLVSFENSRSHSSSFNDVLDNFWLISVIIDSVLHSRGTVLQIDDQNTHKSVTQKYTKTWHGIFDGGDSVGPTNHLDTSRIMSR